MDDGVLNQILRITLVLVLLHGWPSSSVKKFSLMTGRTL